MLINAPEYTIARTRAFAVKQHGKQTDKAGLPYVTHLDAVARNTVDLFGFDPLLLKVAYLHDVVEDTSVTIEQIEDLFGDDVAISVDSITKRKGELNPEYIGFVLEDEVASMVKLADLYHNTEPERLAPLSVETQKRLLKKYRPAIYRIETHLGVPPSVTRDDAIAAIKDADTPKYWTQLPAKSVRKNDKIKLSESSEMHVVTATQNFTDKGAVQRTRITTTQNTFTVLADFKVQCQFGGTVTTQHTIDKYLGEYVAPPKVTGKPKSPTAASKVWAGVKS